MANGWTTARKEAQAAAIRRWKPWECSTGPRTEAGKARAARNAYRGAHRQRHRDYVRAVKALLREQAGALIEVDKLVKTRFDRIDGVDAECQSIGLG